MNLKNKIVTVIGLGNSGVNAANLLSDAGAVVRATDSQDTPATREAQAALEKRNIKVEIGGHTENFIKGSRLIVVSPGVKESSVALQWAKEHHITIISELELGFRFSKGRIIAVTGTNGKSTVTTLIGEILKSGGKDTVVCGNIGNSLCQEIARIKDDTWVVIEVSSFQLERIEKFRPEIALILNITDDHMDRYNNFNDYFSVKSKIFRNQTADDILILNYDAPYLRDLKKKTRSNVIFYSKKEGSSDAYVKDGWVTCVSEGKIRRIARISDIRLKGAHNLENVLASAIAGLRAGVREDSIGRTVKNFIGLEHRFETVDTIDGVEYVDDSKGTTVDSTCRALESCDRPVILIAGGRDKLSDYTVIRGILRERVRQVILIGEAKERIRSSLDGTVESIFADTMPQAVELAGRFAKGGEIVLLSPMCSSFDMFRDYKHRGEVFKEAVKKLKTRRVPI